jgi:hypothetical protein
MLFCANTCSAAWKDALQHVDTHGYLRRYTCCAYSKLWLHEHLVSIEKFFYGGYVNFFMGVSNSVIRKCCSVKNFAEYEFIYFKKVLAGFPIHICKDFLGDFIGT